MANAAKHGVTFEAAITVFLDSNALDGAGVQHSAAEARSLRLGRAADGRCSWWGTRSGEVTMPRKSASSARGAPAGASARRTRSKIDFSDIPDSSPAQLQAKRRVGRPPLGEPRQLIAIRVDAGSLDQFRKEARRRREGYQTPINEVLARHVRKDVG